MTGYFTIEQHDQLLRNGTPQHTGKDHYPVVKLRAKDWHDCWLLTEIDPANREYAFGLIDDGSGHPAYGYVSIDELLFLHNATGLLIAPDRQFVAKHSVSIYAKAAALAGCITDNPTLLATAQAYGGIVVPKLPKPAPH